MSLLPLSPVRLSLSVCLGFGALLTALPSPADTPAASISITVQETRTLPLRHADPTSILKTMHWDQGRDLPDGVSKIRALPKENALSVVATPAGFAGFKELVALLDFAPRRVQVAFVLAHAAAADLQASGLHGLALVPASLGAGTKALQGFVCMASGGAAVQLLSTLRRQKTVLLSPVLVTTNNGEARLSVSGSSILPGWKTLTFAATPRVNSDNSVTLRLHPSVSKHGVTQEIQTLRTVKSGETLVLIDLFPQSVGPKVGSLLLFVTPTILPDENGAPAKRGK